MNGIARTLMSKGEYARFKQRSAAAVSNWIADGRISPAALVGEGQRARIWVERADLDLARNLDPAQQDVQAAPIDQATPLAPASAADALTGEPRALSDIDRRRKADADAAELEAEKKRRQAMADAGKWIDAEEAERKWTRELSRIFGDLETFIGNRLAQDIADEFGLDWKIVSVRARASYRAYRNVVADDAEAAIDAMAEAAE